MVASTSVHGTNPSWLIGPWGPAEFTATGTDRKPRSPPDEVPANCGAKRRVLLPDHFHCELNVTRLSGQVINAPGTGWRSVRIKDGTAVRRLGWCEVRVVQDVENFRAELNIEGFRDAMDWIVLKHGKVHVDEFGSDDAVPAGISQ